MADVMLVDRFPQIITELPVRLDIAAAKGAQTIADRAAEKVADAPPLGEGLVASIHVRRQRQGRYIVEAGDKEHFYGHFLEFGTRKMYPRPFLIPAVEESIDDVTRDVTVAVESL
jgi:HK97 gp10 family phage protein